MSLALREHCVPFFVVAAHCAVLAFDFRDDLLLYFLFLGGGSSSSPLLPPSHTLQIPPSSLQCLQPLQVLQAVQSAEPVHLYCGLEDFLCEVSVEQAVRSIRRNKSNFRMAFYLASSKISISYSLAIRENSGFLCPIDPSKSTRVIKLNGILAIHIFNFKTLNNGTTGTSIR